MRKENSKKVSKEQLVNLLATATYGSTWLGACSLRSERHLDNEFSESYLEERCLEEKWADRLLNGGHIAFIDFKDEDEDGKGGEKIYKVDLQKVVEGIEKSKEEGDWYKDVQNISGDVTDAEIVVQYIIFGEIVY